MPKQSLYDPRTAFAVAQVLTSRLPMLGLSVLQPSAEGSREMARMVAEKQTAWALGLIGAQQALARAWLTGAWDIAKVAAEVTAAAEAPALKALNGNVHRLARRRRR